MSFLRTFHTVRHLRPVQIANRLQRRLLPLRSIPVVEGDLRLAARSPVPPARRKSWGFDGSTFCFLNRRTPRAGERRWTPEGASRLWVYNLHYFEYLWGIPADAALPLMQDWVAVNKDPRSPGWEPYPLSLRIREWVEWLHAIADLPSEQRDSLAGSIAAQAEALSRQVEWHLLGNHIVENAVTLAWAGLSFEGFRAEKWLRQGLGLLRTELEPQILDDGVHDERSPMYQALLAHALLRLAEVARMSKQPLAPDVERIAGRAGGRLLVGLERLVHPDGEYALVNDCAFGIAPSLGELQSRFPEIAREASPAPTEKGTSGYCSDRQGSSYLLFDAGPPGPNHQMGHGHADNLSFELSIGRRRIITDTGVGSYEADSTRAYDRATAAHNTMEVDGRNQSDVWAAFRCGRRAVSQPWTSREAPEGRYTAEGMYRAALGRGMTVQHQRTADLSPGELQVGDVVTASGGHSACVRLHFAPGLDLDGHGGRWDVLDGGRRLASVQADGFEWRRSGSPYHPEFGLEIERQSLLAVVFFHDRVATRFSVAFG